MTILSTTVLALMAGFVSGQSSSEHIWSSVAWVLHGEHTPLFRPNTPTLTPVGAQQMFAQGSQVRRRYLATAIEEADKAGRAPIVGIEPNAIDNSQLYILTNTDSYSVTGSLAFMQGLYPPIEQAFANGAGGMDSAELIEISGNGSKVVNFPLEGYQYPNIRTASVLDMESIWYVDLC